MRTTLDVGDLVRIAEVARLGGFTRAASALGMTQPALTRSIAAAERIVGGSLFRRGRTRSEPTALCRLILADAPGIIDRMQDLHNRLAHLRGGSGEELTVATGPFPLETIVLPAVTAFRRRHRRIRVRIETLAWPAALVELQAQRCDIAVLTAGAALERGDLAVEPLPPQRLVFAVGRRHPLARAAQPSLAQILAHPLVTTAQLLPRLHRALAEARGGGRRADIPFPAVQVESATAWLTLVEGDDCVALTTPATAARFVAARRLAVLPVEAPWLATRHAVAQVPSRPPSEPVTAFVAALREANAVAVRQGAELWAAQSARR
ncbi:MAG: LysR family transcriptional regulator [Reyranellaceae bacterium]